MSDVKVMWGRKRCGEEKWDEVLAMRVLRMELRGCEGGGRSQREEPGIIDANG